MRGDLFLTCPFLDLNSAPPGEADISVPFGDTPFTAQVNTDDTIARPGVWPPHFVKKHFI